LTCVKPCACGFPDPVNRERIQPGRNLSNVFDIALQGHHTIALVDI
jgi:hypothetical protein